MPGTTNANANFGLLYFKRQWRLFGIMFQSIKSASSIMFLLLIILALALQVIVYVVGLVPSKYIEVLVARDYEAFKGVAIYSMEVIVLNALVKSTQTYLTQLLYVKWRGMLCSYLHTSYFRGKNYYKLNVLSPSLDNVDQRMVRDVNVFCQEWSALVPRLIVSPFTISYYSYRCFVSTTYLGPIIIYAYFIIGTILNRFLMSPVVRTTVLREKREGDFRFQHLQVRVNAESMAFYQAEEIEKYKCNKRLLSLLDIQRTLYGYSFWLNSTVNIFDYVGGILSYLIIAIPIFGGQYDDLSAAELSAVVSQNSFVCIYLIYSFSQLFDMARVVSDIAGHTHRLGQLIENFSSEDEDIQKDYADEETSKSGPDGGDKGKLLSFEEREFKDHAGAEKEVTLSTKLARDGVCFEMKNVTYVTPDGTCDLLQNLSLVISEGKNLLVTGQTGCGKTSLFRVLCDLWKPVEGHIDRYCQYGHGGIMFLPQKPVCADGTLKQMVTYPSMDGCKGYSLSTDHDKIMCILDEVGLTDVFTRMGGLEDREETNWSDKLSPGEMQRLSFARLFYHEPRFAVMDEPTSALNAEMADHLYTLCRKKNITCVTAAHSSNLMKHHDVGLHLNGDGSWKYSTLL